MLESKLLRGNIDFVVEQLKRRNFTFDVDEFNKLEDQRKVIQVQTQELQNLRNTKSKAIGQAKASGEDIKPLLDEVSSLGESLDAAKSELNALQFKIDEIAMAIPNIPHPSVPEGFSEDDNLEVLKWGEPKKFDFEPKDHVDLGEMYGIDFAAAAKISGARFVVMTGKIAKLQRALTQFMLDHHTEINGYTETYVPYLVNAESLTGTGQLPKFEADLFKTHLHGEEGDAKSLYLIPTAEVPVTNIVRDSIIKESDLPLKFVAHTPCFRSEAGSYGRDTKGLIRQHQFEKVELVQICGIPGYRARIRPIVSRITIHWPSFYNVVTGKTLALPNLIALQHIPLSPAGVIAKRPAPIALPNSCAAEWRMAPDAVFSPYASVRYFTPHMVHSQYNLL